MKNAFPGRSRDPRYKNRKGSPEGPPFSTTTVAGEIWAGRGGGCKSLEGRGKFCEVGGERGPRTGTTVLVCLPCTHWIPPPSIFDNMVTCADIVPAGTARRGSMRTNQPRCGLPCVRTHSALASKLLCPDIEEEVRNDDPIDYCCGVVCTRWWRVGIFPLARVALGH